MDGQLGFSAWESWIPRVHLSMLLMQFQGRGSKKWRAWGGYAWERTQRGSGWEIV
jgi:hypothetical protein